MALSLRLLGLIGLLTSASLSAQVTTPKTPVVRKGTTTRPLPQASKSQQPTQRPSLRELTGSDEEEYTVWSRTSYRLIERKHPANAPLFYPEVTSEKRGNLFALIFRLLASGKITVYAYQDGQLPWEEAEPLSFVDFLDRYHIPYSRSAQGTPEVALADIPSALVEAYYLVEQSSFEERSSSFSTSTRALCPLLTSVGDYGQVTMPLFWVSYDQLRPYLALERTALTRANAARRATLADFFDLQTYRGEIVLTDALAGGSPTGMGLSPEQKQATQERLERELKQFQGSLYLPDSLLQPSSTKTSRRASRQRATATTKAAPSRGRDKRLRPSKAGSSQPASSSRSVRDRG